LCGYSQFARLERLFEPHMWLMRAPSSLS
jgi:hypothetical protein